MRFMRKSLDKYFSATKLLFSKWMKNTNTSETNACSPRNFYGNNRDFWGYHVIHQAANESNSAT